MFSPHQIFTVILGLVPRINAAWILVTSASMTVVMLSGAVHAQTTKPASIQFGDELQQLLNNPKNQEKLQQGIVIASLMGCTSKTAGKPATDAFYKQMQTTGKQVEVLCKAKRAPEARALVLQTLKTHQEQPVVLAVNNCYSTQKEDFDTMAGPKLANDAENYSRWLADPSIAEAEMTDQDVCK